MAAFAVGLLVGLVVALVVLRALGGAHPAVRAIFGGATEVALVECPDVSVGAPAAEVEDLPEVITAEEARADPSLVARVKHPRTRALVQAVVAWRPRRHRSEAKFQESFEKFLSASGRSHSPEFEPGQLERHRRVPFAGDRVACPDFIYDSVLVELKRGLTASGETDRALGQLLRYLWLWRTKGTAVLVICGEYDRHLKALAQNYVRGWRAQGLPVMALFVRETEGDAMDEVPDFPENSTETAAVPNPD